MNKDKKAAKILGKIYARRASVKDVGFLLNYFLESSSLYPILKDDLPVVYYDMKKAGEVSETVRGKYIGKSNVVHLNDKIIESARRGDRHSFVSIVTTYGHEMNHGRQWKQGHYFTSSLKKEKIKGMLDAVGYAADEGFCGDVAHGSYLKLEHEEDARECGALFAQEVLKKMLDNPYLKEADRKRLLEDIELAEQVNSAEQDVNKHFYSVYDNFKNQFKDINVTKLIESESRAEVAQFVDYADAVNFWIKSNDSFDVCKGYLKLIGKVNGSSFLRKQLTSAINDEKFSRENREKMQVAIMRTFKENDMSIDYYEAELAEVLEEKHILELYEDVITRDINKVDGKLFDELSYSPSVSAAKGKLIAKNYREGKIKINNDEDFLSLSFEITKIVFRGEDLLGEDLCEELESIKDAQFEIIKNKNKNKDNGGRK